MEKYSSFLLYTSYITFAFFWTLDLYTEQTNLFRNVYSVKYDWCEPVVVKSGDSYPFKTQATPTCKGSDRATGKTQDPQ